MSSRAAAGGITLYSHLLEIHVWIASRQLLNTCNVVLEVARFRQMTVGVVLELLGSMRRSTAIDSDHDEAQFRQGLGFGPRRKVLSGLNTLRTWVNRIDDGI